MDQAFQTTWVRRAAFLLGVLAAAPLSHAAIVTWQASSGLTPDQIGVPYTLVDSSGSQNPLLGGGVLTLSTLANAENMYYTHSSAQVNTSGAFYVEFRAQRLSGTSNNGARQPIVVFFTTAANLGGALYIGADSVYFTSGELVAGPAATVDTDGAMHTYRINHDGAGGLSLLYDGNLILTGSTYNSANDHGGSQRIGWGEASSNAFGSSNWEHVTHNAGIETTVPEPATSLSLLTGLAAAGWMAAKRRR